MLKRTFTLGRYLCVERLGEGPLGGETWRAKLYGVAGVERQCALEWVPAHWVAEPGFLERFAGATQAYTNLEHPGLLPLHEVGQEGPDHYLAWDLPAGDLAQARAVLGAGGSDLAESGIAVFLSLVQTLTYVHARGVLHLALCPQAVHLDGAGRVRVSHVGLLRPCQLGSWTERPEVRHVLGYLAPEVLRTQGLEPDRDTRSLAVIDARADVFSVGALLYEWVSGVPAFTGASPAAILAQMTRGPAPASSTTAKGLLSGPAAALMQIAQRALQPSPADRYRTMGELLDALRAAPAADREASQRSLKHLARQMLRRAGADPLHGADPLPPPPAPAASTEETKGFVPPPAQVFVPSASSDVLRDMHLSGPISLSPQRSAEGLASLPDESGPITLARRSQQGVPQQQIPEQLTVPARPSSGLPGVRTQRAGVSSFALEEEESTVPVPHSPRSRIVVIEAEPPSARSDSGEGGSRVGSGSGAFSGASGGISAVPGLGLVPGLRGPSEETPLPASIPMPPDSENGTGSWPGAQKDLTPRPGGQPGAPPAGPGRSTTARLGGGQPVGDEPKKRGGGRPAGFAEFDEPTALADYDTALASLVGLSSDRSDSVPVPSLSSGPSSSLDSGPTKLYLRSDIKIPPSIAARQAAEAASQQPPAPFTAAPSAQQSIARSLADQYAPLITGEVPKAGEVDLSLPAEDLIVADERPAAAQPQPVVSPERSAPPRQTRPPVPSRPPQIPAALPAVVPVALKDTAALPRQQHTPEPIGAPRVEQVSAPPRSRRLPGARPSALHQIVPLTPPSKESTPPPRATPGQEPTPPGIPLPGKAMPAPSAIAVPSVETVSALAAAASAPAPSPVAASEVPAPLAPPVAAAVAVVTDAPAKAVDLATTAVTATGAAVIADEIPVATGTNGVAHSARSPHLDPWSASPQAASAPNQLSAASHDEPEQPVVEAPLQLPELPSGLHDEVEVGTGVRNPLIIALVAGFVGALMLGGGSLMGYRWLAAHQKPPGDEGRALGIAPRPPGPVVAQEHPAQIVPPTQQAPGPAQDQAAPKRIEPAAGHRDDQDQVAVAPGPQQPTAPDHQGEPTQATEPPGKEAAPAGMLTVAATPVAVAFLDRKPAGKTPAILKLSAGMHRLVLVAEKHKLWDQEIQAGEPMKVKLEQVKLPQKALPGWTNIKVRCQGKTRLRVFLDGQDTGLSCPAQRLNVPPGPHEVGVRDPITGDIRTQSVVLKPGPKAAKVTVKF